MDLKNRIKKKQQGIVLVISVIMLSVLMALSVNLLSSNMFGNIFARNSQDQMIAQSSADYVVAFAKQQILDSWGIGMTECSAAPCTCPPAPIPCVWQKIAAFNVDMTAQSPIFWSNYSMGVNVPNPLTTKGRSIIIDLGCDVVSGLNLFRIIAQGSGKAKESVAYSDVIFPMPLSSDNTPASSPTFAIVGEMDGTILSNMATSLSTTHSLYIPTGGPSSPPLITNVNQCDGSHLVYAECQLSCAALVRVMAMSLDSGCVYTYGEWSKTSSQVILKQNGANHTFVCHF